MNIVETRFSGVVTGTDVRSATTEAISLQKKIGVVRFLVSAETANADAVSINDIHDLPKKQYWEEGMDPRSRIAVIRPSVKRASELAQFFENLCRGRSWNVQMFPDHQSAIDWLIAQ